MTIHPGIILKEEFMVPAGLSASALSKAAGIPVSHINDILKGHRQIDADIAFRLSFHFGNSTQFWLKLEKWDTELEPAG